MFGFLFGTVCMIGLVGVLKGSRGGCHGGWAHHHHGFRGGPHGRWRHQSWEGPRDPRRFREGAGRAMAEVLKRKLRIDEDQEGIVDHALADLRRSVHAFGDDVKGGRDELAGAFRGEQVDDAALDALFARWDEDLRRTRREVVSALKQVHAVLDEEQREAAADLLSRADRAGWQL
ncbi:MAG: periplasmic heavy metal sensor [Alphaproteobacteria bacterium]|nr:periplasmic heavy metal sensor [Alphaproteobacteria bacterium]MCB9698024.1 periplasmic heavy metal sensor [Alphaproteobacteria bacterium]